MSYFLWCVNKFGLLNLAHKKGGIYARDMFFYSVEHNNRGFYARDWNQLLFKQWIAGIQFWESAWIKLGEACLDKTWGSLLSTYVWLAESRCFANEILVDRVFEKICLQKGFMVGVWFGAGFSQLFACGKNLCKFRSSEVLQLMRTLCREAFGCTALLQKHAYQYRFTD